MKRLFSSSSAGTSAGVEIAVPDADLTGRLAIVILGDSSESHVEHALLSGLVSRKLSNLILAISDISSGEEVRKRLLEAHPDAYCKVEVWLLDLASFASLKAFGQRMHSLHRLDIFLTGAGVSKTTWEESIDGYEINLQANVISTGLLCLLALPLMKRTATLPGVTQKPHIVMPISAAYERAAFKERTGSAPVIASLNDKNGHAIKDRYSTTNALRVYIARELSSLKITQGINVNCAVTADNAVTGASKLLPPNIRRILAGGAGAPKSEKDADSYLHAILVDSSPAALIHHGREVKPSEKLVVSTEGQQVQKKVWAELCAIWRKQSNEAAAVLM